MRKLILNWVRVGADFEYVCFYPGDKKVYANILKTGNLVGGRVLVDGIEIACLDDALRTKMEAKRWVEAMLNEANYLPATATAK